MKAKLSRSLLLVLLMPVVFTACTPEPQPIHYGQDLCAHCRMTISDERYGAELVMRTGKTHKFDSIECLAGFHEEQEEIHEQVHSLWITDFQHPGELMQVEDAFFLHSDNLHSPMGMNLTAFGEQITEEAVLNSFGGHILTWDEVLKLVASRDHSNHAPAHNAHLH